MSDLKGVEREREREREKEIVRPQSAMVSCFSQLNAISRHAETALAVTEERCRKKEEEEKEEEGREGSVLLCYTLCILPHHFCMVKLQMF